MSDRAKAGDFESAFVAMSYFAGVRGDALLAPLHDAAAPAVKLAERLGHAERNERALALADELAKIARALEQRGFR